MTTRFARMSSAQRKAALRDAYKRLLAERSVRPTAVELGQAVGCSRSAAARRAHEMGLALRKHRACTPELLAQTVDMLCDATGALPTAAQVAQETGFSARTVAEACARYRIPIHRDGAARKAAPVEPARMPRQTLSAALTEEAGEPVVILGLPGDPMRIARESCCACRRRLVIAPRCRPYLLRRKDGSCAVLCAACYGACIGAHG